MHPCKTVSGPGRLVVRADSPGPCSEPESFSWRQGIKDTLQWSAVKERVFEARRKEKKKGRDISYVWLELIFFFSHSAPFEKYVESGFRGHQSRDILSPLGLYLDGDGVKLLHILDTESVTSGLSQSTWSASALKSSDCNHHFMRWHPNNHS